MKTPKKKTILIAAAAVVVLAATPALWATVERQAENRENDAQIEQDGFIRTAASSSLTAAPADFTKAAESTINCVVSIKSFATPRQNRISGFNDPFFEFFFGPGYGNRQPQKEAEPQQLGLGSGVIISDDGYIVTNNHVIEGAEKLEITLNNNKTYNATVIGTDPATDLALLKIDEKDLPVITFGNSDDLKVGEWVLAVGNPFGFTSTVTAGIVSAKARSISSSTHSQQMGIDAFIQTDAAVNPGNSGGALVNTRGELVGINTAIYSQTGNYAGYSFAIPTSIVKKIITDIRKYGTVQRAVLGISFTELTPEIAKKEDITAVNEGIYVASVEDMSAAKEAGVQKGDVITAINGSKARNRAELQEIMSRLSPGDKATLTVIRDNKEIKLDVTMRNAQGNTTITKSSDFTALGCAFKPVSDKVKAQLHISGGVQVVGLKDGKFKSAGITEGFIILDINNISVKTQKDVEAIYNEIMRGSSPNKVMFITGVYPTGKRDYMAVPLTEEE